MASSYSTNLGIELIATGEQSGTWGATTNTNLGSLIEQGIVGYGTQAVTDSGTATVLTIANGALSTGRNYVIELTGALTAARTVTVPAVNKPYIFFNNTTGGFAVTVKVSGQTGVIIANGKKAIVYTNTTDVIEVANAPVTEAGTQTLTNKTLTSPLIGTVIGGTTASSSLTLQSTSGVGTTDSILFKVGNNGATTAMTITTAGNVGIGTSSPTSKLQISSASAVDTTLQVSNTLSTTKINTYSDGSSSLETTGAYAQRFFVNGSERMRINSSGQVGIGTTSPTTKLDVLGTILVKAADSSGTAMLLSADTTNANGTSISSTFIAGGYGPLKFLTANTEAMRIDTSGNLLVGATTVNYANDGFTLSKDSGTTKWLVGPVAAAPTSFFVSAASSLGVYLAEISATSWSSGSDERLKDIIEPIADGLQKVNTLRAVIGSYKADEAKTRRAFLIAQDLQNVLPEAVDASNPDALGVQYTEVIPLLVAAIKELSAKNDALEARLAKLETVQ